MQKREYAINNDFGQVRLFRSIILPQIYTPIHFMSGGWHRCNDLYYHKRINGQSHYMIFFSLSDGGRAQIGDKFYEIPASSMVIFPPEVFHEYYTAQGSWWEFYWIYYSEEHSDFFQKLIDSFGYVIEMPKVNQIGKLLENLFPERFTSDEISYEITASQIMSQILHIVLEDTYGNAANHKGKNTIVQKVIHEIELSYDQKLNIEDLADKHFLSVQHLIRIFKEDTSYTPYEYLKKYRLQKGCELLISSSFSIGEIAEKVGFSNGNNFIYQFKREYNMTPGEYRELYS